MIKNIKILELILLGLIFPFLIVFLSLSKYVLVYLWCIFIYSLSIYVIFYDNKIDLKKFFNIELNKNYKYYAFIIFRWVCCSISLYFFTLYFYPEKLFLIQKNNSTLIYKILIFYPILSAFPQEFIFCTFFFRRYKDIFIKKKTIVLMSAVLFCLAHIFFINIIAPILSFIGGLIFAHTYNKTKSLLIASIEHSLYGNTLFFIGLGWFFWGGSVG